jgi:hypothetical protein
MPQNSAKPLKEAVGTRLIVEDVKKFNNKFGTSYVLKTKTGDYFANTGVKNFIEKEEPKTPFVVTVKEPETFKTDTGEITYFPVECA